MERELNVMEIIQAFIKRIKIVIGIVLIFGLIGGGTSFLLAEEEYQSVATLIVGDETQQQTDRINPINGEPIYETVIQYGSSSISEQSKSFYSETLERQDLLKEVIENLQLDLSPIELKQSINLEVPENSSSLFISVNSSKYNNVDDIVNEVVTVFIEKVYEITEVEKIKVLDEGSEPNFVSSINYSKNILIAMVAGLAISFVVVLMMEYFDDSIQSVKDIEKKTKLSVISEIKNTENLEENIKEVRTKLEHSNRFTNKKHVLVAGVDQNNPIISIELAKAVAINGLKTLLIDGDLRTPQIHNRLSIDQSLGLTNLLGDPTAIEQNLQSMNENLQVLTAGDILEKPSEQLSSDKMKSLLDNFRKDFDYVIINGHPLAEVTDTVALAPATDGVILVVEKDRTKMTDLVRVQKKLTSINVDLLGVIFNEIQE